MDHKFTWEDFKFFRTECRRFQKMLNLQNWTISFKWPSKQEPDQGWNDIGGDDNWAANRWDLCSHTSTICLSRIYPSLRYDGYSKKEILSRVAFHEMLHLVICPLHVLAGNRFVTEREVDFQNEEIVRVLENTCFERFKK